MANKVAIVTDSVACISKELAEKYGIEMVPLQIIFEDKTYQDGIDLSPTEFTPVMGAHTGPGVIGVAFYSED